MIVILFLPLKRLITKYRSTIAIILRASIVNCYIIHVKYHHITLLFFFIFSWWFRVIFQSLLFLVVCILIKYVFLRFHTVYSFNYARFCFRFWIVHTVSEHDWFYAILQVFLNSIEPIVLRHIPALTARIGCHASYFSFALLALYRQDLQELSGRAAYEKACV